MFGQLLIDPKFSDVSAAVVAELRSARCLAAGAKVPLPAEIGEELPGLMKIPEGWQLWRVNSGMAPARVGVAWWSDPTGRRHVRVGSSVRLDDQARRFFAGWKGLTPLARVHPERCYVRLVARQPRV